MDRKRRRLICLPRDFAAADARAQAAIAGEAARLDALQADTSPELIPAIAALARASVPIPRSVVSFPQALSVDLGVGDADASSFAIGYARNSELIELELSALESSGNGEVIARPKVTTQDKMPGAYSVGCTHTLSVTSRRHGGWLDYRV